jgi:hypothetical protein
MLGASLLVVAGLLPAIRAAHQARPRGEADRHVGAEAERERGQLGFPDRRIPERAERAQGGCRVGRSAADSGRHGQRLVQADPGAGRDAAALARALRDTGNDLAPAARRICPEIDAVLEAFQSFPDCLLARLSGSGPTCFGLFPSEREADRAASLIAAARPRWWVRSTRLRASEG